MLMAPLSYGRYQLFKHVGVRITHEELLALLEFRMSNDGAGQTADMVTLDEFLNAISVTAGFIDWIDAYHRL
jgi:hypothetical protein